MDQPPDDRPRSGDRRKRRTRPWDAFRTPARRQRYRRQADLGPFSFVDRYDRSLGIMILMLLILTLTDGVLTMILIDLFCEEANPLMAVLIEHGPMTFVLGKYMMTAVCLPILLVFEHHRMFGTRFRVRHFFPIFIALYLSLLAYQLFLLRKTSEAIQRRSPPTFAADSEVRSWPARAT